MLIILPVILLILMALAILVVFRFRPGLGIPWLSASGISLGLWIFLLVLRWQNMNPFALVEVSPISGMVTSLIFQLDDQSWSYAFALIGLLVAILLTASSRFETLEHPWPWAASGLLVAAGLMAVMAGNIFTLILAWTVIDLIDLVVVFFAWLGREVFRRAILAFSARIIGTVFAIWAVVISSINGQGETLDLIQPEAGIFLLLAAALRLGVVPLHLPYGEEPKLRRGLGTALRLSTSASSVAILSRLPATVVTPNIAPILLVFTALAALYGGVMWLFSKDELSGRPYWLITFAGMCVASAIRGHPVAALAWGTAMILTGGMQFLLLIRQRELLILVGLSLLGLSGLPFTPAASGWQGLVVLPFNLLDIVFMLAYTFLVAGFIRHALRGGIRLSEKERWVQGVYPAGLLFLIITHWLIGIFGWQGSFTLGNFWAAPVSFSVGLLIWGLIYRLDTLTADGNPVSGLWFVVIGQRVARLLSIVFRFDWVYQIIGWLFGGVQKLVSFITVILEGEGGVLWAMVLLALLLSLLSLGGNP